MRRGDRMGSASTMTGPAPASAEGFDELFRRSYHQVLGLVTVSCGRPDLAEDSTQEAFARALERWSHVRNLRNPGHWIARVALNLALDDHRRRRREAALDDVHEAEVPDSVQRIWVEWNLAQLPPMQRAAMVMRYMEGMPVDEVATTLGRSPQTVKTHVRLGRGRLRTLCKETA